MALLVSVVMGLLVSLVRLVGISDIACTAFLAMELKRVFLIRQLESQETG